MKTKELKGKKPEDLQKLLTEKTAALRQFQFDIAGSKIRDVRLGRALRKDIARIKTEQNASK
jgi:ribosomal protein L29